MIKQLASLLKKGDTVTFTVAREGEDQVRLCIYPKLFTMDGEKGEQRRKLNEPLQMTGTPDELDSPEFFTTLEKYTGTLTGLRSNLDEVEAAAETAKEEAKKKSPTKPAPKPVSVKPAVKPAVKLPSRTAPGGGKTTPKVPTKPATGTPAAEAPAETAPVEAEAEAPAPEPTPAPEPPKPVAPPTAMSKTAALI